MFLDLRLLINKCIINLNALSRMTHAFKNVLCYILKEHNYVIKHVVENIIIISVYRCVHMCVHIVFMCASTSK